MIRSRLVVVFLFSISITGLIAGIGGAKLQTIRMQRADPSSAENRLASFQLSKFYNVGVAMVGDSLTGNASWNEILGCKNLINRGIGSETSSDVLKRLGEILDRKPKIVVLMIGANDVSLRVPISETLAAMSGIIDRSRRNNSTVIVHLLLPVRNGYLRPEMNADIVALNTAMEQAFKGREGVTLIDLRSALSSPAGFLRDSMTTDGIHLTADAYRIWRDSLAPHLSSACI